MQAHQDSVQIWEETVTIPTYEIGKPNANPMFFENRVYQGSSGRVYPYPIIESVGDTKKDVAYTAVFLENAFLKIMILPSLGGRIQRIQDKTNNQEVVYYNEVIKPALVGLLGPWISGGIEFNWPQHHRPTTFLPVEYQMKKEAANGSASILLSDIDRMHGTKAKTTITLYPDKAYVEIRGQLYNPTQFPQTFLWWANPAIAVNEHTQSIFPPDVHAVMDHGKRDVSTFPIATGIYYKHDYHEGVDISWYKNIPVPTSYMAFHSDYDFVGSYDHEKQIGILHVADHHISPGKKQWTWGSGDFGKAWDKNLTDTNGPYIELMTGVFTDNQPDFTFLLPGEEKSFTQYFLPFKQATRVCNANRDLVLSLHPDTDTTLRMTVYSTIEIPKLTILVKKGNKDLYRNVIRLAPAEFFESTLQYQREKAIPKEEPTIFLQDELGKVLLSYTCGDEDKNTVAPEPAKAIGEPEDIASIEELYLAAQHLEQYRHATFRSEPYYKEALRRDPEDCRCNIGYGELLLKRGLIQESEQFFRTAIKRTTKHNPNPQDAKAYTLLGLSLFHQKRFDEAYDVFYKAVWDGGQQEQGFLYLGILEMRKENWQQAEQFLNQALIRNSHNLKTRGFLAILKRKTNQGETASKLVAETLEIDPFDLMALNEQMLLTAKFNLQLRNSKSVSCMNLASDYAEAGLMEEAGGILALCTEKENPLLWYHRAYYAKGERDTFVGKAESLEDSIFFPNTLADLKILETFANTDKNLWKAQYLLGCYWYDKMEYKRAKNAWECANKHNPKHAKTLRCLSLVYFNQERNQEKAMQALEKACELDREDDRLLYELDQLYKKCGKRPEERQKRLEENLDLVFERDDLTIEYITLLNLTGHYDQARELELSHSFHPWEGGEGKIASQYVLTHVELAQKALKKRDTEQAKKLLMQALIYPENLHEGKLEGNKDNEVQFLLGCVFEQEENHPQALFHWELATHGLLTATGAMFYYDQSPQMLLYKGLALKKLKRQNEAEACFDELLCYGREHGKDHIKIDYFAVSLPDLQVFTEDLDARNSIHCLYLIGLGNLGKGNDKEAKTAFEAVMKRDPGHWEAKKFVRS